MEDQGKRLLLAVAIAFGIMMAWSLIFPPKKQEKKEPPKKEATSEQATPEQGKTAGTTPTPPANGTQTPPATPNAGETPAPTPPEPVTPRGPAQEVAFDFPDFHAVFTTHGAALESLTLKGEQFEDHVNGGQINLVPTGAFGEEHGDLYPLTVGFEPVNGSTSYTIPPTADWKIDKQTDKSVTFVWSSKDLWVEKDILIDPASYLMLMTVKVKNLSGVQSKQAMVVNSFAYQDPDFKGNGRLSRVDRSWRTACFVNGNLHTNSGKYLDDRGPQTYNGRVGWIGAVHAYFLSGISLKREGDVDGQSKCVASPVKGARKGTMHVQMVLGPPTQVEPQKGYARRFAIYVGPKYLGKLDKIDSEIGKVSNGTISGWDTGFDKSVKLGWFGFISRPLLWLMRTLQSVVVNWGVAIILLTIFVKLATLYWTTKSMRSMREMAKLKPKVEEIQKKYKDDKQKAQVEIMGLYKAHGVNPLSGCLPMLLQMPIWIALYQTLRVAAELYQAPFIPGWIDDLTAPDHYYVLPVLLMGMMFVQAKLTPSTADSMQQKMMQYGLPMVFGVFGFFFPAGLTLYIFTNTCLTAVHHLWMRRGDHDGPGGKVAAAAATSGRKAAQGNKSSSGEPSGDADKAESGKSSKSGAKKSGSGKGKKKKR